MSRTLHRVAWLLAILSTQPSVWGHHSVSAVFDQAKFITATGTLTKVDWFNPHIAVIVDVAGTSGVETWKFQSSLPACGRAWA